MYTLVKLKLNQRQLCDLELLSNSAFAPLTGFMNKSDYQSVLNNMRLVSGEIWPMPIMLDISEQLAESIKTEKTLLLCDEEGTPLAELNIGDIWLPNKHEEALKVFGTDDCLHAGINYLLNHTQPYYLSGEIKVLKNIEHFDYANLYYSPSQLKHYFKTQDWTRIIGFQTRNPMHRAHVELTKRAAKLLDAHVLIHPVVGMTKPGDIDHYTRVRCYQKLLKRYPSNLAMLSLLPLAMRMGGPREALWHALIRKNYGCTHFIIGRDHAGPGNDQNGKAFYDPYAAQELVRQYENEIGITMVPFQEMVFIKEIAQYKPIDEVKNNETPLRISGTEFRNSLRNNKEIPEWFSYPEIIDELRKTIPPPNKQGITIFFTGLSGAGKSTLAKALQARLLAMIDRPVSLLDGDLVRNHLSSELGFSKEHRDLNIKRIGYVASEITKHHGIVLCAPIAPYSRTRDSVRTMVSKHGLFIEIHVSTSLEACEKRDTKGLYKQARLGHLKGFTGIDDPYEIPAHPELTLDTENHSVSELINVIIEYLQEKECIPHTQKQTEPEMV